MEQQNPLSSAEVLEKLLLHLKMNANKFANELNLNSNVLVYHIKNGRNKISANFAEKVVSRFPEISYEWLLTGRGSMLREDISGSAAFPNRIGGAGKVEFEEIMHRLSVDEIVTYIHKYEKIRGFDKNETYKMFMTIRNQEQLIDYLKNKLEEKNGPEPEDGQDLP